MTKVHIDYINFTYYYKGSCRDIHIVSMYTLVKIDCLGRVVLLWFVVCMILLASFFLLHISLTLLLYINIS